MRPVHILWTAPLRNKANALQDYAMMLLSALMAKRLYGDIDLVTDQYGEYIVRKLNIPYTSIYLALDQEYTSIATAKIVAFKTIADNIQDFLYLDYDVFLQSKVPKYRTIIQSDEGRNMHPYVIYAYLKEKGVQFFVDYHKEDLRYYNMGLFRADKAVIYKYYDLYFKTLYSNQHVFIEDTYMKDYYIFLEQNLIHMVLRSMSKLENLYEHIPQNTLFNNKYVWFDDIDNIHENHIAQLIRKYIVNGQDSFDPWFDTPSNFEAIEQTGYLHLAHYKTNPMVIEDFYKFSFYNFPSEFAQLVNAYNLLYT